ncbi:MAG: HIRAN domain-containing protein [Erysipelotrichaceae bacterium]|nr:HIRAN domain-containing protein [Erysipelotrichaceae bacterium]
MNELTKSEQAALALQNEQKLDIFKPLQSEIFLFDTFLSGTLRTPKEVLQDLKVSQKLQMLREPDKFDENTVSLYDEQKRKAGTLPEKDNAVAARLMDAGKCLFCKILNIETKGGFPVIQIGVYLVDY